MYVFNVKKKKIITRSCVPGKDKAIESLRQGETTHQTDWSCSCSKQLMTKLGLATKAMGITSLLRFVGRTTGERHFVFVPSPETGFPRD